MKKLVLLFVVAFLALTLIGCGSISQSYADKVNEGAESKQYLTYDVVLEDLGEPTVNATVALIGKASGLCTWYKGCKTSAEKDEKLEAGKSVDCLVITFVDGAATAASFSVLKNEDKLKNKGNF